MIFIHQLQGPGTPYQKGAGKEEFEIVRFPVNMDSGI